MNNHFGNSRNDELGAVDLDRYDLFDRLELTVAKPISDDIAFLRRRQRVGQKNNDVTGPG
jgi:hypothetical protein